MRKRIIDHGPEKAATADKNWLDLEALAQVEVSSEEAAHPIESALITECRTGLAGGATREADGPPSI